MDIRSIKQTMKMDVLRCKTPAMVRKEFWAHLLAYNLIRGVMAEAARRHGLPPRRLSFQGARQMMEGFRVELNRAASGKVAGLVAGLLGAIATLRVGDRPDRLEPRVREAPAQGVPADAGAAEGLQRACGESRLGNGVSAILVKLRWDRPNRLVPD